MSTKKKNPLGYMVYIIRFTQVCFIFGMIQGIIGIYFNTLFGIIEALIFVGMLGYSFMLEKRLKSHMKAEILEQVNALGKIKKDMFIDSPIPIVVIDKMGTLVWTNESFRNILGEEENIDKNIRAIFADFQMENLPKETELYERSILKNNHHYHMVCNKVISGENTSNFQYVLYFIDITAQKELEEQVKKQRCMVGYIYIDNYEEIMQSIEEVRRPMLGAIIDRKINIWFKNNDVAVCKFDRDRYMIFFTQENLEKMQERKFDILDELRHIQVGNELPVTVSIGIGRNFESLIGSKEDARAAFDLAVGRGGDQAIIKKSDKYTFYGGKTKEVEKSTRVKVRIKAYAFKELLHEADKVLIMGHQNIDMDCLGAAMGVYRAATIMGKKAHIILQDSTFAVQELYNRIIDLPEYQDLFISKERADQELTKQTLLVLVDVHRKSYLEYPALLEKTDNIVVFDHHRLSTDYIENAVLTYIEPFISSTSEMISEILIYLADKVKLTQIEADALLAGITVDTKNFAFKAGVRTFEAAAFLRRAGADSTRVRMLFQNDMETYKIKAATIKDAEIWDEDIAVAVVRNNHMHSNIIAAQIADELLTIKGIQTTFVITVNGPDLQVSARALGDTNVQRIMEMLGGGGHKNIAGAQLKDTSVDEMKVKLREAIKNYKQEGE